MKKLMLLVGAMSASMVWAETTSVSYRYYDASSKTFKEDGKHDCMVVTSETTEFVNGGWYAVTEDVTITGTNITVSGSAHLILCDDASLTVTNVPDWCSAIDVSVVDGVTNSLSIYGQTAGTGGLNAFGGYGGSGIGGCGYYDGVAEEIFDGGTVRIDGGTVTAIGGYGSAGICGGVVTINGGKVTAIGTDGGAGIGRYAGGDWGDDGTVTINGGTVTAIGGEWGAGIGGGYYGAGVRVAINGGTVTATGGYNGAGIGGGDNGDGGTVAINGGTVTATGGENGAGIGGGYNRAGGTVMISGGTVTAQGGYDAAGIGGGYYGNGGTVTINGGAVTATGGESGAGIGGGLFCAGGTVIIDDGQVTAIGGANAAGVGGGCYGSGDKVTISGGSITAMAGMGSAGIGGGYEGNGGAVTINGGKVTAIGCDACAGIGGGIDGVGGDTFCDDGDVEFGENVGDDILTGANVVHSTIVTKKAYAQNHHAMYVTMPVAVARVPQVAGITYSVSNGTGEVVGTLANCTNTYLVAPGDSLTVYFSLNPDCAYTKSTNPIVLSGIRGERTVDLADLPTARLPTVDYMDWDGNERVATSTAFYMEYRGDVELSAGLTYVVKDSRIVPDRIKVNGTAKNPTRIVLCDGVTLSAMRGVEVNADGSVTNALIICGQSNDTGRIVATGGVYASGIGGGDMHSCGVVTIVGGEVTAMGGSEAAGIGGGCDGDGGTVTVNGGTVMARGATSGAGIGGGSYGAGGMVTINSGIVMATGGEDAGAGIGGGFEGAGGMVTFGAGFEGCVLAGTDAVQASLLTTDEYVQDHSAAYVAMPVAELRVPRVAGVTYVVSNETDEIAGIRMNGTNLYRVVNGDSLKLYFVLDPDCTYVQEPKANPKILGEVTGVMTIGLEDLPTVRVPPIAYLDWDDGKLVEKATADYLEYRGDVALAGGVTYVIQKDMTVGDRIRVNGTVGNPTRLILCDGATLTATNGVEVSVDEDNAITHALIICGQAQGSGTLIATGAWDSAGIGGGYGGDGGMVMVNGGIVMATGGEDDGAGIGGGSEGAGGTVTINGGTVMARGATCGAGIGGGGYGSGGMVAFGASFVGGVLAGADAAHMSFMTADEYAQDHSAVYVTMPVAAVHIPQVVGVTYVVSNLTTGAEIRPSGGQEGCATYILTVGAHVAIYGVPSSGYVVVGPNPLDIPNVTLETAVDVADLPTVVAVVEITIPTAVSGCSYVVSNLTTGAEIRPSGGQEGVATYLLPVGAHVAIYGVPSSDYVVVGPNPLDIPNVTRETAVDVADLPTVVAVVEITIPTAVSGCSYVVSNLTTGAEIRPSGGQEGGATYILTVGAHVAIYGVPSSGYVVVGPNPLDIPNVTRETTVDVADLPTVVAVVEITIPTAVSGGSYVVSNLTTGVEIGPSGGQEGGATYLLPIGAHVAIYGVPSPGYFVVGPNPLDIPNVTLGTTVDIADLPTIERLKPEYIDADGSFKTNDTFEVVTADTTKFVDGGWYAVTEDVIITGRSVFVTGSAHLILCDGATLTVTKVPEFCAAIDVSDLGGGLNSLTIYGQSKGSGRLEAQGGKHGAGIGSPHEGNGAGRGTMVVAGGTVTINGGTVTATGGENGAGIGGGTWVKGGTVTINGGTVMAQGGYNAAGIGGGVSRAGGTVVINGGIVTAQGGYNAAGIGGGSSRAGGTVVINGGIVTAIGQGGGKGIGGGAETSGGTVKIVGGTVVAKGWTGMTDATIDGGNVKATSTVDTDSITPIPTNSAGASVYEVKVELWGPDSGIEDQAMNVKGLGGYGTKDIVTIDGSLHLYLPSKDGKYEFTVGGMKYTATVENAGTTAAVVIITPLAPGYSSETYDSEVLAQTALVNGQISFAPASDVENVLEKSAILTVNGYKAMFTPVIYPSGDQWRIRYDLTEAGTNDLEQSVQAVVTNIDLAAIAAAPEEGVPLSLAGGIPGFYYTLFSSDLVADVKDRESHDAKNSDKLCNADGVVTFEQVKKPSDEAGFFTVGASTEAEFTSGEEPGGGFGGGGFGGFGM